MRTVQFTVLLVALFILGAMVPIPRTHALPVRTWTGAARDGKWETAGNWDCNCVPGLSERAVIPAGSFVVTISSTQSIVSLAVGAGDLVRCTSTCTLTLLELLDNSGTVNNFGTINTVTFANEAGSTLTNSGTITVAQTFSTGSGATVVNFGAITISGQFANDGAFIDRCQGTVNKPPTVGSGTFTTDPSCPVVGGEVVPLDYGSIMFSAVPWILIIATLAAAAAIILRQKFK
jgi:hypothetical protein